MKLRNYHRPYRPFFFSFLLFSFFEYKKGIYFSSKLFWTGFLWWFGCLNALILRTVRVTRSRNFAFLPSLRLRHVYVCAKRGSQYFMGEFSIFMMEKNFELQPLTEKIKSLSNDEN